MSVSKPTSSPAWMTRSLHSWPHGLVRSPEASRRQSIHSPPLAMLVSCSSAHSWFSVMPGVSASRMRAMPSSATSTARVMPPISSADLMARASSIGRCASTSSRPSAASAWKLAGSVRSIARRRLPPPLARTSSAISAAQCLARASTSGPAKKCATGVEMRYSPTDSVFAPPADQLPRSKTTALPSAGTKA